MNKIMTSKEKEKIGQPSTVPFPLNLSLLICKPKVESVCISKQNSETKTVELILHSFLLVW